MLVELTLAVVGGVAVMLQDTYPRLMEFFVDNELSSSAFSSLSAFMTAWAPVLRSHLMLWASVFLTAHLLFYVMIPRTTASSSWLDYKLNRKYPPLKLCCVEAARSVMGIAIAAALEVALVEGYRDKRFPLHAFGVGNGPLTLDTSPGGHVSLRPIMCGALVLFVIMETHFYWSHRMLHVVPWLYRHVHKYHHQSFNPDPLSGLSMHPLESHLLFRRCAWRSCAADLVSAARHQASDTHTASGPLRDGSGSGPI